jgi:hypothetical protein
LESEKRLVNRIEKVWKYRWDKFNGIDWISNKGKVSIEERMLQVNELPTEIDKTLLNRGLTNNSEMRISLLGIEFSGIKEKTVKMV